MKCFFVFLQAVNSLKVELVDVLFVLHKSKLINMHVGICAQSHAPGKTA